MRVLQSISAWMLWLPLAISFSTGAVRAFTWSSNINRLASDSEAAASSPPTTRDPVGAHTERTANEMKALLSAMEAQASLSSASAALVPSPSHPSCFFLAIAPTATTTAPTADQSLCEVMASSDHARVEAAASMALCEIKTAGNGIGRVPRECEEWQNGKIAVGGCIEALSRSPQHWSSYSQNLREVVTLCSAYRRWADLDGARALYSSSANTLSSFLSQLTLYEQLRADRESSAAAFNHEHHEVLIRMAEKLHSLEQTLSTDFTRQADHLQALRTDVTTSLNQVGLEHLAQLRAGVDLFLRGLEFGSKDVLLDLQAALRGELVMHFDKLKTTSEYLSNKVDGIVASLEVSTGGLFQRQNHLEASIERNSGAIDEGTRTIEELAHSVRILLMSLDAYQDEATKLHDTHKSDLEDVFQNLSRSANVAPSFSLFDLGSGMRCLTALSGRWEFLPNSCISLLIAEELSLSELVREGPGFRSLLLGGFCLVGSHLHPFLARVAVCFLFI